MVKKFVLIVRNNVGDSKVDGLVKSRKVRDFE